MGSRIAGKRRQRIRAMLLLALSLMMLLTSTVPVQARPVQQQSPAERLDLVPKGCDIPEHKPGEFTVGYESEEAMWAAPQENVAETHLWGPPAQRLVFEEIKDEQDPDKRRTMEEAKKKELETWPGVAESRDGEKDVGYVWGPDHSPGEFWVRYESEEAMEAAPKDNVVEETADRRGPGYGDGVFAQRLRFEEIENVSDPEERRDLEEDKMQRLQELPGVDRVGYAYPDVHQPGEFRVIYDSEEAMKAAPKENVVWEEVDTVGPGGSFVGVQDLLFEEIRDEPDPKTRRDLEEAKIRELQKRPGVRDATYVPGDADPDCYWDTDVTPEGALNFANARYELYGYVCSSGGLEELFGGDDNAQRRLCGIYRSNPEACKITYRPGEFIVHYRSEEAMRSAPRANVVQEKVSDDPHNEFFAQLLVFDEIKDEPEPDRQRIARIARLQELEKRPGVLDVRYAIVAGEQQQECVDAEFGNLGGPGKPQSGEPVLGKAPAGKAPAGKASSGEPVAGKVPPGEAAPENKPLASEPVAGEPSSGRPESGLYDYVCSPEGLEEVFGGDVDLRQWFCIPPGGGGGGGWCYPNCNKGVIDRAKNRIGGNTGPDANGKAGGKAAYKAVLEGAGSGGDPSSTSSVSDSEKTAVGSAEKSPPGEGSSSSIRQKAADEPKGSRSETGKEVEKAGSDAAERTANPGTGGSSSNGDARPGKPEGDGSGDGRVATDAERSSPASGRAGSAKAVEEGEDVSGTEEDGAGNAADSGYGSGARGGLSSSLSRVLLGIGGGLGSATGGMGAAGEGDTGDTGDGGFVRFLSDAFSFGRGDVPEDNPAPAVVREVADAGAGDVPAGDDAEDGDAGDGVPGSPGGASDGTGGDLGDAGFSPASSTAPDTPGEKGRLSAPLLGVLLAAGAFGAYRAFLRGKAGPRDFLSSARRFLGGS